MNKLLVVKSIPSVITIINCLCGFGLILVLIQAQPLSPSVLATATIFIYIAWILDMVDGPVARMLKAQSQVGVQLDSFADLINFGFAPAVLIALFGWQGTVEVVPTVVGGLFFVCALLRLAQFNTDQSDNDLSQGHLYFRGFPSPTAALAVAGMVGLGHTVLIPGLFPVSWMMPPLLFYITAVILSLMMVTSVPFADLPKVIAKNRSARFLLLFLVGGLALVGVPGTDVICIFLYSVYYLVRYARQKRAL